MFSSRTRLILAIVLVGIFAATTAAIAYTVHSLQNGGTIGVEIKEGGGNHISVQVPAAFATVALSFMPDVCLEEVADELEPWWPAIHAAVEELSRLPDGVFVEVDGPGETVEVGKRDGQLYVHVESGTELVNVTVPMATVGSVLRKLERADPNLESVDKWKIEISPANEGSI
jgi:hypothetical protein